MTSLQLPLELVQAILEFSAFINIVDARKVGSNIAHSLNLMLVTRSTFSCVFRVVYHTVIITDQKQLKRFTNFVSSAPSSSHESSKSIPTKALYVYLESHDWTAMQDLWTVLIPAMRELKFLETWFANMDILPIELEESLGIEADFARILSLPNLKHLRLDWHMNPCLGNQMLPPTRETDTPALSSVTHLSLVATMNNYPAFAAFKYFTRLSHLRLLSDHGMDNDMHGKRGYIPVDEILTNSDLAVFILATQGWVSSVQEEFPPKRYPTVVVVPVSKFSRQAAMKQFIENVDTPLESYWSTAESVIQERCHAMET
ncbi:hypothetical protein DL96DRAFT_1709080 [Flagelloscypha sp. PMI_526]|nr:hypothetical protein DL96DRAFT_1709080 [Flagelloscypha sp. PMI_526]